jgi:PDZ domain-containing secreted protein
VNPGGPAATAGIQVGEVITAVNNTPVHRVSELAQVLANLDPGQSVRVSLTTPEDSPRTIMVTLGRQLNSGATSLTPTSVDQLPAKPSCSARNCSSSAAISSPVGNGPASAGNNGR